MTAELTVRVTIDPKTQRRLATSLGPLGSTNPLLWGINAGTLLGSLGLGLLIIPEDPPGWPGIVTTGFIVGFVLAFAAAKLGTWASYRVQIKRFLDGLSVTEAQRGPVSMRFSAEGIESRSSFGSEQLDWCAVNEIQAVKDGIAIQQKNYEPIYIPTESLPDGMSVASPLTLLGKWKHA